jgi:hypothetical protein
VADFLAWDEWYVAGIVTEKRKKGIGVEGGGD